MWCCAGAGRKLQVLLRSAVAAAQVVVVCMLLFKCTLLVLDLIVLSVLM
jgi:hypothetical protein